MAHNVAPGLLRRTWDHQCWPDFESLEWDQATRAAQADVRRDWRGVIAGCDVHEVCRFGQSRSGDDAVLAETKYGMCMLRQEDNTLRCTIWHAFVRCCRWHAIVPMITSSELQCDAHSALCIVHLAGTCSAGKGSFGQEQFNAR